MATLSIPYVKLREQQDGTCRPRFEPNRRVMDLGFRGQDLRHDDGRWYTRDEAHAFAADVLKKINAARESGKKFKPAQLRQATVEHLLRDWIADFEKLVARGEKSPATLDGYRKTITAITTKPGTRDPEEFARALVGAVQPPEANEFINYLINERGRHQGRACRATLSAAFNWGRTSTTWRIKTNSFAGLKFGKPDGRICIYSDTAIRALVAAGDYLKKFSIGDSTLLGLLTGQRQSDRLAMEDAGHVDGRRQLRQSKTGALIAIPDAPRLAQRLLEAKARVAAIKLERGTRPTTIVVCEATGLSYKKDFYRREFAAVRAVAIAGVRDVEATAAAAAAGRNEPVWILPPCPELIQLLPNGDETDLRDQDLRDTAVTWLARAGCTIPEIASITGHDLKSIHNVLKHYLAITPELADAAISKLVTWMDDKGMAV